MEILETQVAHFAFNEQGQNHELKYCDSTGILYTSEKKILLQGIANCQVFFQ